MASTSYVEILVVSILLIIPFLYETSHIFRYYLKFFIYYSIVTINSVILIPFMLFRPFDVRNLLWASSFCHHISTILGLRWQLRGREHLEKDQACIIVANHQSAIDILGMFDIWPVMNKCTVVAKKELWYAWPFGLAAWLCGLIFIDRSRMKTDQARTSLTAATEAIKLKKIKLWVFPEGTRRNTGEIHHFKKGAFHMAISAQIPILPVVISSYYFLNSEQKRLDPGNIIITTLPPISTHGLTLDNVEDLMESTRNLMNETFIASTKEVKEHILKPLDITKP
ncbi:1-acyl-sn-glycerol-3-phosphate acyltransferase alpha [Chrysoperla carnea]|uniref:1-acyl-sn-glycerol-3-phosphate acyltransferase alpha n=1 Tax=Chrysoperla carnea TaxID=189513 RepID=UPI001D07D554|nr:1-acyl-sn-glycerol-3-phosphate acyltransferase alpha [Chrysoperla carnea]